MQFDRVEMAKLCQIIPPRKVLIMFSCILLNRLMENCWTIWSNFLENPISFLGSTLQGRTICNISIKNRQKFLEKVQSFCTARAPVSLSLEFFYSRFLFSRRVSKNSDFSRFFIFVVADEKNWNIFELLIRNRKQIGVAGSWWDVKKRFWIYFCKN